MPRDTDPLPLSLPPRGLSRTAAAVYVGVGPTLFDQMVRDRLMPRPIRIYRRVVWDRLALDVALRRCLMKTMPPSPLPTIRGQRWLDATIELSPSAVKVKYPFTRTCRTQHGEVVTYFRRTAATNG